MSKPTVKIDVNKTYLAMIKNSIGSDIWRHLYGQINGQKKDLVNNGQLSCAFFVSSVLLILGLINKMHATVRGLEKDLIQHRWRKIKKPKPGCLLVWEANEKSSFHRHVGFYLGQNQAVSTNADSGLIERHHLTFGRLKQVPKRRIEVIYWSQALKK